MIFSTLYSNTFMGANQNPLSDGGNWASNSHLESNHPLQILSQQAVGTYLGSGGSYYSGGLDLTSDQFVQFTVTQFPENIGNDGIFARARWNSGTGVGYKATITWFHAGPYFLLNIYNPNNQILNQQISLNIGDVIAFYCQGSAIGVLQNGTSIASVTDTYSTYDGTTTLELDNEIGTTGPAVTTFSTGSVINGGFVSGNVGIAGATITATGSSGPYTTTADGSGNYSLGLANGTWTITPSLMGYTFAPSSQNVTVSNANITGVNFTPTSTDKYSVPDCRDYATFPNLSVDVNGTETYTVPAEPSHADPVDSRTNVPEASGAYPQNSRTPGTYGPGE